MTPLVLVVFAASAAMAQSPSDDPYGVPGETRTEAPPAALPDTVKAAPPAPASSAVDTAKAPAVTSRSRVTRETTINPINRRKGNYRSPKKALFMSLVVPGLGQAYVGQSSFTYARAGLYFGTEILLGTMWYQYTVVKYDRQVDRYRRFADTHWSQGEYEARVFQESPAASFELNNPYRATYCEAVQEQGTVPGQALYNGCRNALNPDSNATQSYMNFRNRYDDQAYFPPNSDPDAVAGLRADFADPDEFYALIGRYQEFISGWDDAVGIVYSDSGITGTSVNRDTYNAMRQKAQDYSRMQAWFIGGLVLNHIASAVDAALTARRNNKRLYETEAMWYDRWHLDGGLAFDAGRPRTHMTARLSF